MGFRRAVWDPKKIISQIITMQFLYYAFLSFLLLTFDALTGNSLTLAQFFSYQALGIHSVVGCVTIAAFLLNSLAGAVFLLYIVERAKKCLDFAATVHCFHFFFCIMYQKKFPNTLQWWVINAIALFLMTVLGEYLCMRRELKEIPLSSTTSEDRSSLITV